ncbi:MAG: hypothetical protein NWE89_13680 [Candidatus Bathyarchaeota archaeon]|nr:hypothetical protein [Candidatus Bathyarchaeota archaeon]
MDKKLLNTTILELLNRSGALKYDQLLKQIKKSYKGINENEMDNTLMKMEIQGLVKVYRIPRGKWRIEPA